MVPAVMLPSNLYPPRKDTAEIRWFFREPPFPRQLVFPDSLVAQPRVDWYAFPCDRGCGIKLREGRLETKLRLSQYSDQVATAVGLLTDGEQKSVVSGQLESWCKWSVAVEADVPPPSESLLRSTGWKAVHKERFLRTFAIDGQQITETMDRPSNGCDLEWTTLQIGAEQWWTIGLESVGETDELTRYIGSVVREVLAQSVSTSLLQDGFELANSYGYPEWLWRVHAA